MKKLFQPHEVQFVAWFSGIFLVTVFLLASLNLLPSEFETKSEELSIFEKAKLVVMGGYIEPSVKSSPTVANTKPTIQGVTITAEDPIRIVIPLAGVDIAVRNPQSTNPDYLDTELTRGVVHYPGSGMPGAGNMFIFGHSTGFSAVQNQAYKAFNSIHNLEVGDEIKIYSTKHIYTYKVQLVKKVDKNDTWVRFDGKKNMLTLSTCDSFGTKADRYVVEAEYVGIQEIKG
ncbi:MAG: sortase [Patescibacteria group bacterium]